MFQGAKFIVTQVTDTFERIKFFHYENFIIFGEKSIIENRDGKGSLAAISFNY